MIEDLIFWNSKVSFKNETQRGAECFSRVLNEGAKSLTGNSSTYRDRKKPSSKVGIIISICLSLTISATVLVKAMGSLEGDGVAWRTSTAFECKAGDSFHGSEASTRAPAACSALITDVDGLNRPPVTSIFDCVLFVFIMVFSVTSSEDRSRN